MTSFEFGDVVLVPFPFTDLSTTKRRPAAVVSSPSHHRDRSDLVILAITTQARPLRGVSESAIVGWKQAGLIKPSLLKPVVTTIERGLVIRKLGRLDETDRRALDQLLRAMLGP
jgi:mRNA interferase MazF